VGVHTFAGLEAEAVALQAQGGALPAGCLRLRLMERTIRRLVDADVETVVAFSLSAWAPVFASLEGELGSHLYGLLWPDWWSAQARAVEAACREPENDVWVAVVDGRPVGFVVVRWVNEDAARVGEVSMIAVDPAHQNAGLGTSLMERAVTEMRAQGVDLAVIATGGDPGHASARALYERFDFKPLPQVRYYLEL
jgi:ribosomal protein S18 acetylase RimI-like enzyme